MRTTAKHCDRCGACFTDQPGSVIEVKAGELVNRTVEILDLCPGCTDRFCDWLRSGHQAAHAGPVGAIPAAFDSLEVKAAASA